jgi:hypothetical protein
MSQLKNLHNVNNAITLLITLKHAIEASFRFTDEAALVVSSAGQSGDISKLLSTTITAQWRLAEILHLLETIKSEDDKK